MTSHSPLASAACAKAGKAALRALPCLLLTLLALLFAPRPLRAQATIVIDTNAGTIGGQGVGGTFRGTTLYSASLNSQGIAVFLLKGNLKLLSGDTVIAAGPHPIQQVYATLIPTNPTLFSFGVTLAGQSDTLKNAAPAAFTPIGAYQVLYLMKLAINPTNLDGGAVNPAGAVLLNAPAPSGGATINLVSSDPAAVAVPATVTVPAGAKSASFTITTSVVSQATSVSLSATYNNTSTVSLELYRLTLATNGLTLTPSSVTGGRSSTGTVTLNAAPSSTTGSVSVKLTSSNPSVVSVPSTVAVSVGSKSASFSITTHKVSQVAKVTIQASFNGSTAKATLTLTP